MIGKLLGKEEINPALVLALSVTIAVLVAKGDEPLSLRRVLSNPVSGGAAAAHGSSRVPAPRRRQQQVAA